MVFLSKKLLTNILVSSLIIGPVFCSGPKAGQTTDIKATTTRLGSLKKTKPEAFWNNRICVLNSVEDPDFTHITFFAPDLGKAQSYSCSKNWENFTVLRSTFQGLRAGIKNDEKFDGYRKVKTYTGYFLENILRLTRKYSGTILIDEHKAFPIWSIHLKDKNELTNFISYLRTALGNKIKENQKYIWEKPLLILSLEKDESLSSLTSNNQALLDTWFNVVNYKDSETAKFLSEAKHEMDIMIRDFEAGGPHYVGETFKQTMFRELETFFKDFECKKITPWTTKIAIGIVFAAYAKTIIDFLNKKLPFIPQKN